MGVQLENKLELLITHEGVIYANKLKIVTWSLFKDEQ